MKSTIGKLALVTLGLATPFLAFAAPQNFAQLVTLLVELINSAVKLLSALALLLFFWGLVKYIYSPGGEGYEEGRKIMIWGIVALFVLFCVFGITEVLVNFLNGS